MERELQDSTQKHLHIGLLISILLIILALVYGLYVRMSVQQIAAEPVEQWRTYTFGTVTFKYPNSWNARDDFYYTPAGYGGHIGATFTPPVPQEEVDLISIGGRQVSCEIFITQSMKCVMIADVPIYTASTNEDVVETFETMVRTARVDIPEWTQSNDETLGYSMDFYKGMTLHSMQPFPAFPSTKLTATVYTFPKSMLAQTSIKDASVSVTATSASCELWNDGASRMSVASTTRFNGLPFEYRTTQEGAAGNFYEVSEYSTTKDGQCFRIVLFIHGTNPGMQFEDSVSIEAMTLKNRQVIAELEAIYTRMASTFVFRTPSTNNPEM
jgi:hypothetical protein